MGSRHIGHRFEDSGGGSGTVRIGRSEVLEIGGDVLRDSGAFCGEVEDVFLSLPEGSLIFTPKRDNPETIGGGNSKPSEAFLESWRAKSEACHHSRNLRKNMLVGSSTFKLLSSLGYSTAARYRGLKKDKATGG